MMIRNTFRLVSLLALTALLACAGTVSQAYQSDTPVDSIEGFVWPASGPADPSVIFEMPSFPGDWTAQLVNSEHFMASGPTEQVNPFTITVSTPVLAYV